MKSLPSALATHVATRQTTLATALKITRTDGLVMGFTTCDVSTDISGVTYSSNPGLLVTDIVIAANPSVGNLELRTLHDGTIFTPGDILGGRWRNAAFVLFRYNWASVADGIDTLLAGTLGEITLEQNMLVAELRDLRQYLQQPVGFVSSKTCPYRLGDARCGVNVALFTVSGTITHVSDGKRVIRDSARAEAADYFGEGEIRFTSGDNEGISAKVAEYAANGTFTLSLPLYINVQVGDTYTAIAGDRKRLEEDCRDKFNNVLRFGGQPHRRGINNLTAGPDPAA